MVKTYEKSLIQACSQKEEQAQTDLYEKYNFEVHVNVDDDVQNVYHNMNELE